MGEWSHQLPTTPGRYFFRDEKYGYYGVCLVAWSPGSVVGDWVQQPELGVRAQVLFGSEHDRHMMGGETSRSPNWAYSGSKVDDSQLLFWSEPVATPPDFPSIKGRPPGVSKQQIADESKRAKAVKRKQDAVSRQAKRARAKRIAQAIRDAATVMECTECERVLEPEELVDGTAWSCPHCYAEWVGEERDCPDCNRPFGRVEERKRTCPDCLADGLLPDASILVEQGKSNFGGSK